MGWPALSKKQPDPEPAAPPPPPPPPPPPAGLAGIEKVTTKHVYDSGKQELRSRSEFRLQNDAKVGLNYSDKSGIVSVDVERGPYKLGFDYGRNDLAFGYQRKMSAGTLVVKQLVPGLKWEVVPTPIVELTTKLLEGDTLNDELKLVYDYQTRSAFYTETLKWRKRYSLKVAGDNKSSDHAFTLGYTPDRRWLEKVDLTHTPEAGPLLGYHLKPAKGWKVQTEAALRPKILNTSVTYKAQGGDTEIALDGALPLDGSVPWGKWRVLRKAGIKVDFKF